MGGALINARAETMLDKPSFRPAADQRMRCVVVTEGFYEWQINGKDRQPYYIFHAGGDRAAPPLMFMAGLFDVRAGVRVCV